MSKARTIGLKRLNKVYLLFVFPFVIIFITPPAKRHDLSDITRSRPGEESNTDSQLASAHSLAPRGWVSAPRFRALYGERVGGGEGAVGAGDVYLDATCLRVERG